MPERRRYVFDWKNATVQFTGRALIEACRRNREYEARLSLPPGQECESAGLAMVYYRDRRIWLACAIRDGEVE